MQSEKERYIQQVSNAVLLAQELRRERPDLDFSCLLHTFLSLQLGLEERLSISLERGGARRVIRG